MEPRVKQGDQLLKENYTSGQIITLKLGFGSYGDTHNEKCIATLL